MWRTWVVVLIVSAAGSAFAETVFDEDFEHKQGEWHFAATRGNVDGLLDATEPAGGHSLRLDVHGSAGRATWTCGPRITLKPSTAYRLQVGVMRVGVQAGGRAYLILYEDGVETPPQVKITGPVTCSRETIPEPTTLAPEPITRDGQPALRWRVPVREAELKKRLRSDGPAWETYHFLYVEPQAGCPQRFAWRWRTESGGQPGPEHEIAAQVTVLPPEKPAAIRW